jgi:hypothetical protein
MLAEVQRWPATASTVLMDRAAMNKRLPLVAAWSVVAMILMYTAILDIMRWRADPDYVRLGLDWTDSYLPHGIVAAVIAAAIMSTHRLGLWIAVVASSLFGVYFAAYLVFGSEGMFALRVLVPLVLLGMTCITIRYAIRSLSRRP